jgi:hypothetical protein
MTATLDGLAPAIYFVGPWLLAAALFGRDLRRYFLVYVGGAAAFLLAWVGVATCLNFLDRSGVLGGPGTVASALAFAALAAVWEEPARLLALRVLRRAADGWPWRTTLLYACGHAGGEALLVGLLHLRHGGTAPWPLWVAAVYRVVAACVVQACFTAMVRQALVHRQARWFVLVLACHFAQDLVGGALVHALGEGPGMVARAGIDLVLYPAVLLWIIRRSPVSAIEVAGRVP